MEMNTCVKPLLSCGLQSKSHQHDRNLIGSRALQYNISANRRCEQIPRRKNLPGENYSTGSKFPVFVRFQLGSAPFCSYTRRGRRQHVQ